MAYVYMLLCKDGSIYTGTARDLGKRMRDHFERTSAAAAYTRAKGALRLLCAWECEGPSHALRAEAAIKRLTRAEKDLLVADPAHLDGERFPSLTGIALRLLDERDTPLAAVRRQYG